MALLRWHMDIIEANNVTDVTLLSSFLGHFFKFLTTIELVKF